MNQDDASVPAERARRVAVIGVGRIGSAVCTRLIGAGHDVRAYDVRPQLRSWVESGGASWHDSARHAVADAGLVLTVLPGSPELRELMLGPDALLPELGEGPTWIDLTSTAPDLGAELAAAAHHVAYLDAPLGGGADAVAAGAASLFVGGEAEVLERARPVLEAFADPARIRHLGPAGSGYIMKLLVNLLWFGQAVAAGEALLLASAAGLDLGRVHEALVGGPASSAFVEQYVPLLYRGDYVETFPIGRCVEELDSVARLAAQTGTPFTLSAQTVEAHRRALELFGDVDGELLAIRYLESRAGRLLRP